MPFTADTLARQVAAAITALKAGQPNFEATTDSHGYIWDIEAGNGRNPWVCVACNVSGVLAELTERMVARGHSVIGRPTTDSVEFGLQLNAQPL